MNNILINHIANRALDLMRRQKLIIEGAPGRPIFYAWPRDDRLILVIDPEMIRNQGKILSADFKHDLSTILAGRRVVQTNSRGIFIQVAYTPPPAPQSLRSEPLDMTSQPSPLHIPIGMTRNGPFWISLVEADSIIVAGRRGMGKSRIIHGCIMALIHGGQAELYLRDGKGGLEFLRYAGHECVKLAQNNLKSALLELQLEVNVREKILSSEGVTSTTEFNEIHPDRRMSAIALVIDEIAHIPDDCRPILGDLIGRCRAYGIFPIMGTTYPGHKEVGGLIKANIGFRIALPVPTQNESRVILGAKGAESLPKIQGRMLFEWNARMIEAQAFIINLPDRTGYLGPILSGNELEIARRAVETGALMSIELLKQDYSMSEWKARNLLNDWAGRGWLIKDANSSNARRFTPLLRDVLAHSSQVSQSPQSPQSPTGMGNEL